MRRGDLVRISPGAFLWDERRVGLRSRGKTRDVELGIFLESAERMTCLLHPKWGRVWTYDDEILGESWR